jgi:hypothetical protein
LPAVVKAEAYPLTQISAAADPIIQARIFKREVQITDFMAGHSVIVETNLEIAGISPPVLAFQGPPLHFVDRVDLSNLPKTAPKVTGVRTGNIITRFRQLGFADRAFLDPQGFTPDRYKLNFLGTEPCQDRPCWAYEVTPERKARHHAPKPFFTGTIWVETADFTIIRFKGNYTPPSHIDRTLTIRNYFPVDAYRIEAGQHLWLPDRIISSNTLKNGDCFFPEFEAQTTFSDYKPNQPAFTPIPLFNTAPNPHSVDPISHCSNQDPGSLTVSNPLRATSFPVLVR